VHHEKDCRFGYHDFNVADNVFYSRYSGPADCKTPINNRTIANLDGRKFK
jgi:hypothetical protein